MKRILALHPSSELYGADRIFVKAVNFLEKCNKVDVVLHHDGELVDFIHKNSRSNIIIRNDMPVAIRSLLGLRYMFNFLFNFILFYVFLLRKRKSTDVLYVNTLGLFACTIIGRALFYKKIITHSHEMIGQHGLLGRLIVTLTALFSHKVICVSSAVAANMAEHSLIKFNDKFVVVHNGIEDKFTATPTKHNGKLEFLLLGRIMPEKGQWFTVDALSMLTQEELGKVNVKFVGSPPPYRKNLKDELQEHINEKKLLSIIELIDFVSEPDSLISNADICLVPSIMPDPFPTTVLESLMHGKPVITTNHGGAREIVESNFNGLTITPSDVNEYAHALRFFIDNQNSYDTYAKNARKSFLNGLTLIDFEKRFLEQF